MQLQVGVAQGSLSALRFFRCASFLDGNDAARSQKPLGQRRALRYRSWAGWPGWGTAQQGDAPVAALGDKLQPAGREVAVVDRRHKPSASVIER